MVRHQAIVSLGLMLGCSLAGANAASAQPTELYRCLTQPGVRPDCWDVGGLLVSHATCPVSRQYDVYLGQYAFVLRNDGPIEIEIDHGSTLHSQFPLLVEIVSMEGHETWEACANLPGYLVMRVFPRDICGAVERSRRLDISSIVPLGSPYAVRFYSIRNPIGTSPGVDCVRVTSYPVTAAVQPQSWGTVKCLYE